MIVSLKTAAKFEMQNHFCESESLGHESNLQLAYLTTYAYITPLSLATVCSLLIMEDKFLHVYDVMVPVSTCNNASAVRTELHKT